AILQDRGNEFIRQISVRSSMTTWLDGGGKWRPLGLGKSLLDAFELAVERTLATADASHFAAGAGGVPADSRPRRTAFTSAEHRDLCAERVLVFVAGRHQMRN